MAMAATEASGCLQAATTWSFNCASWRRLTRLLRVSCIVSTSFIVDTIVFNLQRSLKDGFAGR
jgi:hypothetical protein